MVVPDGARVEVFGASRRADGGIRLTLANTALYRFTGDAGRGETNGHGAEGGAFAITPTGRRAGATR